MLKFIFFWVSLFQEDLEEDKQTTIYDDFKFVTKEDLERLDLTNLIGTNLLRAYMHGFFIDYRLYKKVRPPFIFAFCRVSCVVLWNKTMLLIKLCTHVFFLLNKGAYMEYFSGYKEENNFLLLSFYDCILLYLKLVLVSFLLLALNWLWVSA